MIELGHCQACRALAAVEKGPLPPAALDRLSTLPPTFSGEQR
jgi:hypothetical protein